MILGDRGSGNNRVFFLQANRYYFTPRLNFSGSLLYNNHSVAYYKGPVTPIITGYDLNQIGLMAGIQYSWLQTKWWEGSSGIEFGLNYSHFSNQRGEAGGYRSRLDFIGHLNLAKIRFGRQFGGFIQLGYGAKGIIGAGIDFRLKP